MIAVQILLSSFRSGWRGRLPVHLPFLERYEDGGQTLNVVAIDMPTRNVKRCLIVFSSLNAARRDRTSFIDWADGFSQNSESACLRFILDPCLASFEIAEGVPFPPTLLSDAVSEPLFR